MKEFELETLRATLRYLLHINGGEYKTHPQRLLIDQINSMIYCHTHNNEDFLKDVRETP